MLGIYILKIRFWIKYSAFDNFFIVELWSARWKCALHIHDRWKWYFLYLFEFRPRALEVLTTSLVSCEKMFRLKVTNRHSCRIQNISCIICIGRNLHIDGYCVLRHNNNILLLKNCTRSWFFSTRHCHHFVLYYTVLKHLSMLFIKENFSFWYREIKCITNNERKQLSAFMQTNRSEYFTLTILFIPTSCGCPLNKQHGSKGILTWNRLKSKAERNLCEIR